LLTLQKKVGAVRHARKAPVAKAGNDDKRLQTTLKRLGTNNIPGVDEVRRIARSEQRRQAAAFPSYLFTGNVMPCTFFIYRSTCLRKMALSCTSSTPRVRQIAAVLYKSACCQVW
jgi:hypothetical protein